MNNVIGILHPHYCCYTSFLFSFSYTHIRVTKLNVSSRWFVYFTDKKVSGKSKDEQMAEKKQELEKRLQDVTGQLGTAKKNAKKGKYTHVWVVFGCTVTPRS